MTLINGDLRQQAERRVPNAPTAVSDMSADEIESLVYELQVHQEELEIQNEELRRIQTDLQTSNDRYADLYDFAPVGYLTIAADGEIIKTNLKAASMLGQDRSKVLGANIRVYCDQSSRANLADHIDQVMSGNETHRCELIFDVPNGTKLDARLDSNRVSIDSSEEFQCRTILTDISQRKRDERTLIEKDQRLQSITNALPVLICYIDTDLKFRFCNATHDDWFGTAAAALIGQKIQTVLLDDLAQEVEDYFADALCGRRVEFETQAMHQQKGLRHLQVMFVPDVDPDGKINGIHGLGVDITERKVIEEQNARRRGFSETLVRLNPEERDVYELLIRGKSNKTIAVQLDIGLRTAERRRQTIFEKLDVDSVAELLQQLADIQGIEPR